MSSVKRMLMFAAELFLTCVVIGVVVLAMQRGLRVTTEGGTQAESAVSEMTQSELKQYDGVVLTGQEVLRLYSLYHATGYDFQIATKETIGTAEPYFTEVIDGLSSADARYVNPEGIFFVEILEENGEVTGFRIAQR